MSKELEEIDAAILDAQARRDAVVAELHDLHARRDEVVSRENAERLMSELHPDQLASLVKLHGLRSSAAVAATGE